MLSKTFLRKEYLDKRKQFSEYEIKEFSNKILEQIEDSSFLQFNNYHIFLPIVEKNEINTFELINHLWCLQKSVFVPKIENNTIESYQFTSETLLQKSKWNTTEPIQSKKLKNEIIKVVFIPLLICDYKGNRVGYGKGFYDKFLAECSKSTLKIGLNFFNPIENEIETNPFDIALDYLVTPDKIVSFLPISEK